MNIFLKNLVFLTVILIGIPLFSCSSEPSDDVITKLIFQSTPNISELKVIKVGKYDKGLNRLTVRAKYLWTPHSAYREECVTDFIFFKDIGTGEWKLHISPTNISRKHIS
jgi:hypothetical protein